MRGHGTLHVHSNRSGLVASANGGLLSSDDTIGRGVLMNFGAKGWGVSCPEFD